MFDWPSRLSMTTPLSVQHLLIPGQSWLLLCPDEGFVSMIAVFWSLTCLKLCPFRVPDVEILPRNGPEIWTKLPGSCPDTICSKPLVSGSCFNYQSYDKTKFILGSEKSWAQNVPQQVGQQHQNGMVFTQKGQTKIITVKTVKSLYADKKTQLRQTLQMYILTSLTTTWTCHDTPHFCYGLYCM